MSLEACHHARFPDVLLADVHAFNREGLYSLLGLLKRSRAFGCFVFVINFMYQLSGSHRASKGTDIF